MNKGKICVSVCAETAGELAAKIRQAEQVGDVIEVRFDCLHSDELNKTFADLSCSKPLLATCRSPAQGGRSQLGFEQRHEFWNRDLSNFWAIDIEEDLLSLGLQHPNIIVSHHDFESVPNALATIADRLFRSPANIVKIAVTAKDVADSIPLWNLFDLARRYNKRLIPIAMGEAGKWTRILGLAFGAPLTYASLEAGSETADAQLTAHDLTNTYRVKAIDRDTRVYGVIGDPVSSSRSPQIQNAAFHSADINAVFLPLQVKDPAAFFQRMVKSNDREIDLNFAGFAVTMPHKQAVIEHLDEIDPIAKAINAVNTIRIEEGRLTGYNTDVEGFIKPLKKTLRDLKDAKVAILGAGGGARACVFGLREAGADVTVFARDAKRALSLAAEFGVNAGDLLKIDDQRSKFDIIVNATPIGMDGTTAGQMPITEAALSGVKLVYDLVTCANDTPLIAAAKRLGIPTIDGSEMLIEQGAKQFEIWTGCSAPVEAMRNAII